MTKAKILVVDDEIAVRFLCERVLSKAGYEVKVVENGQQGLEQIKGEFFDLVLTDLKMPGVDGMEILTATKELELPTRTVMMTGYGTLAAAMEAVKRGAFAFIVKPFSIKELRDVVEKCLAESREIRIKEKEKIEEIVIPPKLIEVKEAPPGVIEERERPAKETGRRARIAKLKEMVLADNPQVCLERARLLTEASKEYDAELPAIKRAKSLAKILNQMSIYILDEELLVGNLSSKPRKIPLFPEYDIRWIESELEGSAKEPSLPFKLSESLKRELREIVQFWKGKTLSERALSTLPESVRKAWEMGIFGIGRPWGDGYGYLIVDLEKVLNKGLNSIIAEAEEHLLKLDLHDPEDIEKRFFLEAIPIALKAVIDYASRYAQLALEMANKERDPRRRRELERIARISKSVPANPARTFQEALQSVLFIQTVLGIESSTDGFSLGRFDQYLYPFYEKDIREGRITREQALELIECLWIKLFSFPNPNLTVGGQRGPGRDSTNELSYLCLEARDDLGLDYPLLSVRYHSGSTEEFLSKSVKMIGSRIGTPLFCNDEVIIPALLTKGINLEDAYDYAIVGNGNYALPGKSGSLIKDSLLNLPKILELALNNGKDPRTEYALHPRRGDLSTFTSFEEVMEALREQSRYYLDLQIAYAANTELSCQEIFSSPLLSALVGNCLQRGRGIERGGAVYDFSTSVLSGLATVVNSLIAIRKLIFEDKLLSGAELKQALATNFRGKKGEEVRRLIMEKSPKYGNGDDEVDSLARDILAYFLIEVSKYKNVKWGKGPLGCLWQPAIRSFNSGTFLGALVGATPDGREAKAPIPEGLSPYPGTIKNGLAGVIKSAGKMGSLLFSGGQSLELELSPSILQKPEGLNQIVLQVKRYFDLKGMNISLKISKRGQATF